MATEQELAAIRTRLFGLIEEERIAAVEIGRPPADSLAELDKLTDLAPAIADALDQHGVGAAAPASLLAPLGTGQRLMGPAITIRYVRQGGSVSAKMANDGRGGLADRDLYNVGQPGDVAVFDCGGFVGAAVMGGLSAAWAKRTEIAGCVIDGAVRDVEAIRDEGIPVWSRAVTPVSGNHRIEAVEINGDVMAAGLAVRPGDVIVADETGVCVIPIEHFEQVKHSALEAERAEREMSTAIEGGTAIEDVVRTMRTKQW